MKNHQLLILVSTIILVGCSQPQTPIGPKDEQGYYIYNPADTIENEPFLYLLYIDSSRVAYIQERPMGMVPTVKFEESEDSTSTVFVSDFSAKEEDVQVFDDAEAKWFKLMDLCSKKQYEDALELYTKEQPIIGIALATSTLQFDLDFYVTGPMLFDILDREEAAEQFIDFLNFDKLKTESVISFSTAEGGSGYIPPHYAYLLKTLIKTHIILEDWKSAEALVEPYRNATYLVNEDAPMPYNERTILDLKLDLYAAQHDIERAIEACKDYRDCLSYYALSTGENVTGLIEDINEMIEFLEEIQKTPRVNANT